MFVGGGCLLRVLVMKFEGEACLHRFWRDALGQQRGPAQELRLPHPTPVRGQASGRLGRRLEATGPRLHRNGCPMSSSCLLTPELPLAAITMIATIYRALTISQVNVLQSVVS